MKSRCTDLASKAADWLSLQPVGNFYISTPLHKRSVFANLQDGSVLGLKGCGWTLGPPYAVGSKKDAELWLGLLDKSSGIREGNVSSELQAWGVNCATVVGLYKLDQDDLLFLGISDVPIFSNGKPVEPVILATRYKSKYRIGDCIGPSVNNWIFEFERLNPSIDHAGAVKSFAIDLASSILIYQARGAVNDTLGPENITLGAEITDFEWIYTPGTPLPNGQSDEILRLRQQKEWIYFLESIHTLAFNLSVEFSIASCIDWVHSAHKLVGGVGCGFIDAANEMVNVNDN